MASARATRILLVEDEPDLRLVMATALGRDLPGSEVVAVPDAYQALAALREERFDAAVVDLVMPGANGSELLRRMSRDEPVPVVVVTALSGGDLVDAARRLGASAILQKPVDPWRLADEVARATGTARPTTGTKR